MNGKKKFREPSNLMNLPKSYKRARYINIFFLFNFLINSREMYNTKNGRI